MFKKKERLTKRAFADSFAKGTRVHSPFFQLIQDPHKTFHGAAVVGKKVFKKAVDRNTLRRRMYGALYRFCTTNECSGVYILIAKPKAKELSQKDIAPAVKSLLDQRKK